MSMLHGSAKVFALVTIVALLAGCSGAGSSNSASTAATPSVAASTGASSAPTGELPEPELDSIKIGVSAPNEPVDFRAQLASMLGLFEKYGLKAEVIGFEGDAKTLQALTAGQIDFGIGSVANALSSQVSDTPNVVVGVGRLLNTDGLWCRKGITTADDVKGKSIAISTFGGTSNASALAAVEGLGLTTSDVVITQVGGESERVAALKGGSIDCIIASAEYPGTVMQDMGATDVINLQEKNIYAASAGTEARIDWLAKNPNTALVAQAAMLEAQCSVWTDTETAVSKFVEFTGETQANAEDYFDEMKKTANRDLMWEDDSMQALKDTLASVRPEIADVSLADASDHTWLQKLADIGFYDKIGCPIEN
ncbi:MAG TPA: ABC transporter substrate-binding protein [Nitrolancea sp.]|jgi:NitT/TauT family transport system substrate-binding protein